VQLQPLPATAKTIFLDNEVMGLSVVWEYCAFGELWGIVGWAGG